MNLIIEDKGFSLLESKGKYYIQYYMECSSRTHIIKKKRIEITKEEAELCQLYVKEMFNFILKYQDDGVDVED